MSRSNVVPRYVVPERVAPAWWKKATCKGCGEVTPKGALLDADGLCADCAEPTGGTCRTAPRDCEVGRIVDLKRIPAEQLKALRLCTGHNTWRKCELARRRGAS